jgi:hypothetical protein
MESCSGDAIVNDNDGPRNPVLEQSHSDRLFWNSYDMIVQDYIFTGNMNGQDIGISGTGPCFLRSTFEFMGRFTDDRVD